MRPAILIAVLRCAAHAFVPHPSAFSSGLRHTLLAVSCGLAVGLLATTAFARPATAPLATPAIPGVVCANIPIELIREGLQGTEGPGALTGGSRSARAVPTAPRNLAVAGPGKRTLYVAGREAAHRTAMLSSGGTSRAT